MSGFPKISIVTPSYNQGQFIEDTILSVIGQRYPNLEYIIMDGGSTDNTIEIIKKYESHLAYWVSEKDRGQSHAINKGFDLATGEILAWLNSDDMYLPGTLAFMSNVPLNTPTLYFGNCIHFKEDENKVVTSGSDVVTSEKVKFLEQMDYIIQPSCFWTRTVWDISGRLREDMHYAFDWEWFIRAKRNCIQFYSTSKPLSLYRFHQDHKSNTGGEKRLKEILDVYKLYNKDLSVLFEKLLSEDLNFRSIGTRFTFNFLKRLGRPRTLGNILKALKSRKYANYSVDQINDLAGMIGRG